jgi:hypothetical protein
MEIFHKGLRELLLINNYLKEDNKIGFLTIECPLPELLKKLTQAIPNYSVGLQVRREYRHFQMGIKALSLKNVNSIFVMEAYNQHLLFLLPMLATTGKNIFICIHGNQQFAQESRLKALGLKYLQYYLRVFKNFKVVLLELDDDFVPDQFKFPEHSKLIIPHPMVSEIEPRLKLGERLDSQEKIKIGLIGIIRPDKPIDKILKKLGAFVSHHNHICELVIGTPFQQKPSYLDNLPASLYDTTTDKDYLNLLQKIDILVTDYDRERYYYRASGVISDAASSGCYIIAPDYPIIKHQITWPETVGSTFTELDELDVLLEKAIDHLRTLGKDNHWQWRRKRSAEHIASLLTRNYQDIN